MIDFLNFNSVEKENVKQTSEAEKIFKNQVRAIKRLVTNKDFDIILGYFKNLKDINENSFEHAKTIEEKNVYFALYKQSKNFLNYIENLKNEE